MGKYKIDKYRLHEEAAEQPDLLYNATKKLPDLYDKKRSLTNDLNSLESELFLDIKRNPQKYFGDLDKPPTDTAINKMVATQKEIKALKKKLLKAEVVFMKANNKASAIESRRSMIKYMEELYNNEYWSITKVSDEHAVNADLNEAKETIKKKNKKIKKKRRIKKL